MGKRPLVLAALAMCLLWAAGAAPTVHAASGLMSWDFAGNTGSEVTVGADHVAANVSPTPPSGIVSRGSGINPANNADRFNANNWTQPTLAAAVANNDYFEFSIAPEAGFQLDLTSIVFNFERSPTGPQNFTLRSSEDGFTTDLWTGTGLANGTTQTITLTGFSNLTSTVTFRLYGYGNTNASGSAGFEGAGDDLVINGTVSAVPPTDTNPPQVTSFNPTDDSTDVAVDTNLQITFDEDVEFGSGSITIFRSADDSVVETFDVTTSSQLSISGGTVTINPSSDLDFATDYYVTVDNGAIEDLAGNPYAGFTDKTVWNFTTAAPPPALIINEIDYEQPSGDAAEFVEIKNVGTTAVDLSRVELIFVDAAGPTIDRTIALMGTLAAGDYFVICGNAANVPNCDLDVTPDTNLIENDTEAVGLRLVNGGALLDVVSYEGCVAGFSEGASPCAPADPAASAADEGKGISRFPDMTDTDSNKDDFSVRCISPGAANIAQAAACTTGTITIIKDADIASDTEFSFTSDIPGGALFWLIDDGTGTQDSQTFVVEAGSYTITEGDPIGDWMVDILCSTESGVAIALDQRQVAITVAPGDEVTCTFENTAELATIILTKETLGFSDDTAFPFTGDLGLFELTSGETITFEKVTPLQWYDIQESLPYGWNFRTIDCNSDNGSFSAPAGLQIRPFAGETVVCTITNEAAMATITVEKVVAGLDSAADYSRAKFDFDGDLPDFDLKNGERKTFEVVIGEYRIYEDVPANWALTDVSCTGGERRLVEDGVVVAVGPEDEVVCTFTNAPRCTNPSADLTAVLGSDSSTAVVRNHSTAGCSWDVGMASYAKTDEIIDNQILFDYVDGIRVGPGEEVRLSISLPDCAAQVDVFWGPVLFSLDGQRYGERRLASRHVPGNGYCERDVPSGTVSGFVALDGEGLAGVNVSLLSLDERAGRAAGVLGRTADTLRQTTTDAQGYYAFEDIPVGRYQVSLSGAVLADVLLDESSVIVNLAEGAGVSASFSAQSAGPMAVTLAANSVSGDAGPAAVWLVLLMLVLLTSAIMFGRRARN